MCLKLVALEDLHADEAVERLTEAWEGGDGEPLSAIIKDEERCIRCALCAERCPTDAITMERFSFKEVWVAGEAHAA